MVPRRVPAAWWHRTAAYGIVGVGCFLRDHAFVYFDCGSSGGGVGFSLSADHDERCENLIADLTILNEHGKVSALSGDLEYIRRQLSAIYS